MFPNLLLLLLLPPAVEGLIGRLLPIESYVYCTTGSCICETEVEAEAFLSSCEDKEAMMPPRLLAMPLSAAAAAIAAALFVALLARRSAAFVAAEDRTSLRGGGGTYLSSII
jgi:hypothetical protein